MGLWKIWRSEKIDSESFVIEALPRTVVYTLQDGDIGPDTDDDYLSDWNDDMGDN
jgi:hypothetical protein